MRVLTKKYLDNLPQSLVGTIFVNGNRTWQIISYGNNFRSSSEYKVFHIKEVGGQDEELFMTPNNFAYSFSDSSIADKISKFKFYKSEYAEGGLVLSKFFSNPKRFVDYSGKFLYPPRIKNKVHPDSIEMFDDGEYVAQPKLNGSNTSVFISKKEFVAKERHNKFFANPPKFDFQSLYRGNGNMCITGEFMNKSKKDHNNKSLVGFCIWDILAYDGKLLIGSNIEERIALLEKLYPAQEEIKFQGLTYMLKTDVENIYRVNNFYGKFDKLYKTLSKIDMVEGLVLKQKNAKLQMMIGEENNSSWSVKVRKPTLNYSF